MKQLTIISGKGGTGKTSITASFASLATNSVFADCDVDAADLHLIFKPKIKKKMIFYKAWLFAYSFYYSKIIKALSIKKSNPSYKTYIPVFVIFVLFVIIFKILHIINQIMSEPNSYLVNE